MERRSPVLPCLLCESLSAVLGIVDLVKGAIGSEGD
jgi:hypothetical protein